jgi:hypothetical protein
MTEETRKPVIPTNILWREEGGNTVLFNEADGEPYLLNETGSRIWELCHEGIAVEEILRLLSEEFDGDPAAIETEALALLQELAEKKLLELQAS